MNRRTWLQRVAMGAVAYPLFAQSSEPEGLNALARRTGRMFGFAINPDDAGTEPVNSVLQAHAGVITAENAMKWRNVETLLGSPDYAKADRVAALADQLKAALRGHTLAWHQSTPLRLTTASQDDFVKAQTMHLKAMVERYRGRTHTWDVLNEVVEVSRENSNGMRISVLSKLWGVARYPALFELAREADPHAKLAYNDYGMEQDEPWCEQRRVAMLNMLEGWVRSGVPITTVGLQAHLNLARKFSARRFSKLLDDVLALGLNVQITELDISDQSVSGDVASRDAAIAALYNDFVQTCVSHPAVEMVVMWNVTDANTWLNRAFQGQRRADGQPLRPTLFDVQGQPKLAFHAVAKQLRLANAPHRTESGSKVPN